MRSRPPPSPSRGEGGVWVDSQSIIFATLRFNNVTELMEPESGVV